MFSIDHCMYPANMYSFYGLQSLGKYKLIIQHKPCNNISVQ